MRRVLVATATLSVLLTGCASTDPAQSTAHSTGQRPAGAGAVRLIDELDRLPVQKRPTDLMASVRPHELVVTDGNGERVLPLPRDRFYLSVAPYVSTTHECFYHSLTTCRGELGDRTVHVTVTDESGTVLLDRVRRTFDNGFLGLWLPRGTTGTIAVEYDGKVGRVPFSTGPDDPTCLTTLKLA